MMAEKPIEKLDHVELVSSQDTEKTKNNHVISTKYPYSSEIESTGINERKTLRKIDVRVVPMVTILYLLSWLDRGYI
jgi:3D (Asp-Asp-Asp) domain-containing protein